MQEDKFIPKEYISIRQVWLQCIDACNRAKQERSQVDSGKIHFIDCVQTLLNNLVDYGEALIKTEVKEFMSSLSKVDDKETLFSERDEITWEYVSYYENILKFIIRTLNKYGMLFDTSPKGYCNTNITELTKEEYDNLMK